jgi:hypothetical protein
MHLYQTKPPHSQTCLCMGLIHLSSIKSTALVRFENSACSLELSPWGGTQKRFLPSSLNVFTVEILTKYYPLGLVYHGAISFRHKGGSKEYLSHSDLEGCLRSTCTQWNKKKYITSDKLDFSDMRLESPTLYSFIMFSIMCFSTCWCKKYPNWSIISWVIVWFVWDIF